MHDEPIILLILAAILSFVIAVVKLPFVPVILLGKLIEQTRSKQSLG